jgi:hypothetical protein
MTCMLLYCPLYLAWLILDEARDYFRTPIPEAFAEKLGHFVHGYELLPA